MQNNQYLLPDSLYKRVLWVIRDYPRMRDEYYEILHSGTSVTMSHVGSQRSGNRASSTERIAIKLSSMGSDMQAVEQALFLVPQEYRDGVLNNVLHGSDYPKLANKSTYWRWKQKFIYLTAMNLNYV